MRTRADAIASSMGRAEPGGFDTPDIGPSGFAQILTPGGGLEMSRGFRGPTLSATALQAIHRPQFVNLPAARGRPALRVFVAGSMIQAAQAKPMSARNAANAPLRRRHRQASRWPDASAPQPEAACQGLYRRGH